MFTGIVTARGRVTAVARQADRLRVTITAPYGDLGPGESVAVNGACLTVVQATGGAFTVEVIVTTRGRTRLAELREGDLVNLERALAVGDRMGGHFVQGHVDGLGTVARVQEVADAILLDVDIPPDVAEVTVPHGSIALDGVSLTVNAVPAPGRIQVALIPYTREQTTLGALTPGDQVQVEGDLIGKVVRQLVAERGSSGAS
jgi:riboflavin synthase